MRERLYKPWSIRPTPMSCLLQRSYVSSVTSPLRRRTLATLAGFPVPLGLRSILTSVTFPVRLPRPVLRVLRSRLRPRPRLRLLIALLLHGWITVEPRETYSFPRTTDTPYPCGPASKCGFEKVGALHGILVHP